MHFRDGRHQEACDLVKAHHYSGRPPANIQFVGTMHQDGGLFGDFGEAVAACFFSIPPTRWSENVLELSRLVRTPEMRVDLTQLISFCAKALRKRGETLLVSFADKTEGHHGGVYQAASWHYAGARERRMDGVLLDGVFIPGRSCNSKFGTRSPKLLSEKLGRAVEPHFDEGKHLYFKPLGAKGASQAKRLGLESKPYPKPFLIGGRPVCASLPAPTVTPPRRSGAASCGDR